MISESCAADSVRASYYPFGVAALSLCLFVFSGEMAWLVPFGIWWVLGVHDLAEARRFLDAPNELEPAR